MAKDRLELLRLELAEEGIALQPFFEIRYREHLAEEITQDLLAGRQDNIFSDIEVEFISDGEFDDNE
jgi:hypothetical protein